MSAHGSTIPPAFDDAFLDWFREQTESAWAAAHPPHGWQRGTRWTRGLSDATTDAAERRWGVHFPPDYRRFLRRLHTTDRPPLATRFIDHERTETVPRQGFYDWRDDVMSVRAALDQPLAGISFDVEHNRLWRPSWGSRPATPEGRAARVRELARAAPSLIPVYGHRYLLGEPHRAGNPVLSIRQADIVVYGDDLRAYLLREFADLLGLNRAALPQAAHAEAGMLANIPFWGEVAGA